MWIECKIFESHGNNYLLTKWFILEAELLLEDSECVDRHR